MVHMTAGDAGQISERMIVPRVIRHAPRLRCDCARPLVDDRARRVDRSEKEHRRLVTTALMVLVLVGVVAVRTAHAAVFDVTSTADQPDVSIDDVCAVANSSAPDARRSKK
jgi:hypothetical protein